MSVISSQKPSILVILRREYLEITKGNFCAAKLIEYFKHWTKWKLKTHRTPWIYQPLKNIHADLMGEHSLHVIRSAIAKRCCKQIATLIDEKILKRRSNPNNKQDKTYQYQINLSELNKLLESRRCNLERSEFNVETHQQITDPQTSDPQKQAAGKEKCLEQEQLTSEPTNEEQPAVTRPVEDCSEHLSTNELPSREDALPPSEDKQCDREALLQADRPSVDTTPPPDNEREEENIKLSEVRSTVGKLTPRLKKLIAEHTLGDLRKALALYRDRCSKQQIRDAEGWLKKCLQQRWWQEKSTSHTSTDARQDNPEPKRATEKLTQEQKVWYENAIGLGICLPSPIEELPIRMGSVCARVVIPNRRPFDPPFEVLPIEKLMVQYPIGAAAEVKS
ncbi:hypothetical protein [Calothrix sp. CCY 0018]|uniref:hypothetical protein n=1 Tax=Calothrix sp. CCY 0018 TaxID=3103864 RepID=UPI0039C6DFF4